MTESKDKIDLKNIYLLLPLIGGIFCIIAFLTPAA